jgi:lanthanide-dependent methanol dehydrogenase
MARHHELAAWKIAGGTASGWISYDPVLNLIYYGTSGPAPWNAGQRPGGNKWTAAVFARDPRNGDAVWAYQWSPHSLFDYGGINESVLVVCRGIRRHDHCGPPQSGSEIVNA